LGESIGKAYKPWVIASLLVLVGSLVLLGVVMTVAFLSNETATPLWVIVLAVIGALGVALGFGGLFLMMAVAGWHSAREARRVQVIPPGTE
jgi:hypothetical protein